MVGILLIGLGRSPFIWALATFFTLFFVPIIQGSSQAIWQAKVAPDLQGRVFAARGMIAQISAPVAMLLAGPLADRVFEPAMMPGGHIQWVGWHWSRGWHVAHVCHRWRLGGSDRLGRICLPCCAECRRHLARLQN